MSQKDLANSLKAVIIGVGLCGLVIYFYFLPVWGKAILQYAPEYAHCYFPWMLFLWITAVPCYLVLLCGWKISVEIGKDNSFSAVNARLLKYIAGLAAFDSVLLFVGSGVFYVREPYVPWTIRNGRGLPSSDLWGQCSSLQNTNK